MSHKERLHSLPNPQQFKEWQAWAGSLVQRLIEFSAHPDDEEVDLLLAATGAGGVLSATFAFFTWTQRLKASKLYFAATGSDTITFAQRGSYIINADLNFTATALQNIDARVYISGVDYGVLTGARGEGTNFIKCPILGAYIRVSEGDTLKIAVQGSATTVLFGVSRLWVKKC